jgi:hypothetical protein
MDISSKIRALGWYVGVAALAASLGASPGFAQGGGETGGNGPAFVPQSGYWWVQGEPAGRAVVIEVNASGEFYAATLVYNDWGLPTWYVVDTETSASGQQSGQLQQFAGGQTLNGEYHPNSFIGFVGTASFTFDSPTSGTVSMPGIGTLPIKRYDVILNGVASGPAAGAPTPGWWWDPNENGRGFYIEVQGDNLLFLGMMYDDLAQPIWYLSRGPMTTTSFYQGEMFENYNGQTINGSYEHPDMASSRGNISIQFTSNNTAVFTNPMGRQITLQRYTFN